MKKQLLLVLLLGSITPLWGMDPSTMENPSATINAMNTNNPSVRIQPHGEKNTFEVFMSHAQLSQTIDAYLLLNIFMLSY